MNIPAIANESNVVSINVGGRIFQTTKQTLTLAGTDSLLSKLATDSTTRFVDRDPNLFSVLLYILRTGNLPARSTSLDLRDLIEESRYYGIEPFLIDSLSNPSQFEAFDLRRSKILQLNGRDSPSTIAPSRSGGGGGLHMAHGSKITSFDWSLRRKSTVLTNFSAVDSLLEISPGVLAAGATDFPGLQIIDLQNGSVRTTLNWENVASSTVQGVGSSSELLFASFESSRRNSNSVMAYDLSTLSPVLELDRRDIYGAGGGDSAIPSTKLRWIRSCSLLMVSGSHASPSGVSGHVRFWDVRSRDMVCEIKEREDCFADVTVSENLSAVFKVGVSSGEVFYKDLRSLGEDDRWVCLGEEKKRGLHERKGVGCKIESYGNHVFVSKGSGVELWSEVITGLVGNARRDVLEERVFRKNSFAAGGSGEKKITGLAFGGSRMFVTRKDQQSIEVWQSPGRGVSM